MMGGGETELVWRCREGGGGLERRWREDRREMEGGMKELEDVGGMDISSAIEEIAYHGKEIYIVANKIYADGEMRLIA